MALPEISIRRHVLAVMLNAVLILFGLIAYGRMGVDRFPQIDFPVISVTTVMRGANPDVIDTSLTSVIESAVNSVPGIEHITSTSTPGVSVVAITFSLTKNIDVAFNEVQAKINQSMRLLPDDADPPIIAKLETGAQAVLWLALQGDRTLQQLNQYARANIKKRLETIDGVGEVLIGGERKRMIRINLDIARMTSLGVTAQDIFRSFQGEHFQLPGGFIVGEWTESLIKLDMEYHDVDKLNGLIVGYRGNAPIRLGDVAQVEDGLEDFRQLAHFNREPAVGLGIVKIANSNTVAVIDAVKQKVETDIAPNLPSGMRITVASDQSTFIKEMIATLDEHIITGTILAALVVWVFLRNFRSTFIIALAIPVSLLGAVAVMYFAEFTFNTMTLLALLLLIGIVVDDAIVVLENIYRHRETIDPDPMSSAIHGTNEVVFAVLASTFTLVSIFAPVIFIGGIIGKFFKSFAVVVTFGVLVSLFVSMTLTPMLCSRFLQLQKSDKPIYKKFENFFTWLDRYYHQWLEWSLGHKKKVMLFTLIAILSSFIFFASIGKGFVPDDDEGRFMVSFKAPLGSNIEYANGKLSEIEEALSKQPEIIRMFTTVGGGRTRQVNQGYAYITLAPKSKRDLSQSQVIDEVRKKLAGIAGVQAFASKIPLVGGMRGEALQFSVRGTNLDEVAKYSEEIKARLQQIPDFGKADLDLQLDLPQLKLDIDRTRAASLGLNTIDIAMAVNILAGGVTVAKFNDEPGDGERYDITIKGAESQLKTPEDLKNIYLRGKSGDLVRLDTVAKFEERLGPAVISKYDLQYSGVFFADPKMPLGTAVEHVKTVAADILPAGYTVTMMGQAEEFAKTMKYMVFTFMLATVLVYMVLSSQFNSFTQPFVIMLAQPLAMIGGVGLLWVTGHTLNIYSMIGIVLLIGLVAKNSILLIDLTNQYRDKKGMPIDEALKAACPIRLRPVLMTSFTVILALLPAALGLGAGSDTNGPLAVVVIGGMVSSTLLTLVVIPVAYSLTETKLVRVHARIKEMIG